MSISLPWFGKFSAIIALNILSVPLSFLFFSFWNSHSVDIVSFYWVPSVLAAFFTLLFFFPPLWLYYFNTPIYSVTAFFCMVESAFEVLCWILQFTHYIFFFFFFFILKKKITCSPSWTLLPPNLPIPSPIFDDLYFFELLLLFMYCFPNFIEVSVCTCSSLNSFERWLWILCLTVYRFLFRVSCWELY